MSKIQACTEIANEFPHASRQELIAMFIEHVGCTPNAASTYASQVRKHSSAFTSLPTIKQRSDSEIKQHLNERFNTIDTLAEAACTGKIRSLVISGAPGVGKSYSVEKAVNKYDPQQNKSTFARGFSRATGLYLLLYKYRHAGNVIVLDDIDSVFQDDVSLNLLKAALDTSHKRVLSWRSQNPLVDEDGNEIDRSFEYNGTVIFLTNINFDKEIEKKSKMAPHLSALMSRSMVINIDLQTTRDYFIRIEQVVEQGMLKQKNLNNEQQKVVMSFFEQNFEKFRELSLRSILKLADLYKINPSEFESLAKVSLFKNQYQF